MALPSSAGGTGARAAALMRGAAWPPSMTVLCSAGASCNHLHRTGGG